MPRNYISKAHEAETLQKKNTSLEKGMLLLSQVYKVPTVAELVGQYQIKGRRTYLNMTGDANHNGIPRTRKISINGRTVEIRC